MKIIPIKENWPVRPVWHPDKLCINNNSTEGRFLTILNYRGWFTWPVSVLAEIPAGNYMASFSLGFSTRFPFLPFCFVEYTITAPAQHHVLARAEIYTRLHEVFPFFFFPAFQPGRTEAELKSQPGKPSWKIRVEIRHIIEVFIKTGTTKVTSLLLVNSMQNRCNTCKLEVLFVNYFLYISVTATVSELVPSSFCCIPWGISWF